MTTPTPSRFDYRWQVLTSSDEVPDRNDLLSYRLLIPEDGDVIDGAIVVGANAAVFSAYSAY